MRWFLSVLGAIAAILFIRKKESGSSATIKDFNNRASNNFKRGVIREWFDTFGDQ